MEKEKGFRLFDNYDDDGQFRLFDADFDDWDEDWEEEPSVAEAETVKEVTAEKKMEEKKTISLTPVVEEAEEEMFAEVVEKETISKPVEKAATMPKMTPPPIVPQEEKYSGPEIRVRYCSTCGKLLFVKEDATGYSSECNHCEIKYFQKA